MIWNFAYQLIVAKWPHMATYISVNIGSGNGLLPDSTKPLPKPILTDICQDPEPFT